jgi:flagellar hook-basal body complex protein FliE
MTIAATTSLSQALSAYGAAAKRLQSGAGPAGASAGSSTFGSLLRTELEATRSGLREGEAKALEALSGRATNLQQVVEAVTQAELGLQKITAVRDRVISAYQDIMRMPV